MHFCALSETNSASDLRGPQTVWSSEGLNDTLQGSVRYRTSPCCSIRSQLSYKTYEMQLDLSNVSSEKASDVVVGQHARRPAGGDQSESSSRLLAQSVKTRQTGRPSDLFEHKCITLKDGRGL